MTSWRVVTTEGYETHYKRYSRRRKRELFAIIANLQRFVNAINIPHASLRTMKARYIHREPNGIVAIGQEGGYGKGLAKTRLYTYPDAGAKTLYLLCIGGEKGQSQDIQYCREQVRKIKRQT